jgi:type III secretion protein T
MPHADTLTALLQDGKVPLAAFGLAMARCLGLLQILPLASRLGLQGFHRAGVAAALSLLMLPVIMPEIAASPVEGGRMALLVAKEAFVGTMLGVVFALPFWTAETAGALIDQQRGLQSAGSGQTDPANQEETGITGLLLVLTIAVLFLASGGMHWLLQALLQSYQLWQPLDLAPHLAPGAATLIVGLLDSVVRGGLLLASPLVGAMLLAELALALVSRFAPQLNVFDLSMSVKGLVQVFGLPIYAVFLIGYLQDDLRPLAHVASLLPHLIER